MATTRIIPLHLNKGKTLNQCLKDRTDYAENPEKTAGGNLVSSYACDPNFVSSEFALSKKEYKEITGRIQKNDIIAYQLRQSFKSMTSLSMEFPPFSFYKIRIDFFCPN